MVDLVTRNEVIALAAVGMGLFFITRGGITSSNVFAQTAPMAPILETVIPFIDTPNSGPCGCAKPACVNCPEVQSNFRKCLESCRGKTRRINAEKLRGTLGNVGFLNLLTSIRNPRLGFSPFDRGGRGPGRAGGSRSASLFSSEGV